MWPFSLFKKQRDKRQNNDLTQGDSESGAETMATKGELNRLKIQLQMEKARLEHERDMIRLQTEIEDYRGQLDDLIGDDEEEAPQSSGEDQLFAILAQRFLGTQNQQSPAVATSAAPTTETPAGEPTNEQLREMWQKLPAQYKDQALKFIKQ